MIRLEFRLRHDCALSQLAREFPEVPFSLYCSYRTGYLEIGTTEPTTLGLIRDRYARLAKMTPARVMSFRASQGLPALMVPLSLLGRSRLPSILDRSASVMLYPIDFLDGWETYRSIIMDDRLLPRVVNQLRTLGPMEVLRKRNVRAPVSLASLLVSLDDALTTLTSRQKSVMLRAVERGYYENPRLVNVGAIATGTGLSRTTYGYHMRRAESKLVHAVAPYLRRSLQNAT